MSKRIEHEIKRLLHASSRDRCVETIENWINAYWTVTKLKA